MASSSTEMAIFQRVAERGSFAGAAEDVGLSPSAVAKLITRFRPGAKFHTVVDRESDFATRHHRDLLIARSIFGSTAVETTQLAAARIVVIAISSHSCAAGT
jgi:hypothetical protein